MITRIQLFFKPGQFNQEWVMRKLPMRLEEAYYKKIMDHLAKSNHFAREFFYLQKLFQLILKIYSDHLPDNLVTIALNCISGCSTKTIYGITYYLQTKKQLSHQRLPQLFTLLHALKREGCEQLNAILPALIKNVGFNKTENWDALLTLDSTDKIQTMLPLVKFFAKAPKVSWKKHWSLLCSWAPAYLNEFHGTLTHLPKNFLKACHVNSINYLVETVNHCFTIHNANIQPRDLRNLIEDLSCQGIMNVENLHKVHQIADRNNEHLKEFIRAIRDQAQSNQLNGNSFSMLTKEYLVTLATSMPVDSTNPPAYSLLANFPI